MLLRRRVVVGLGLLLAGPGFPAFAERSTHAAWRPFEIREGGIVLPARVNGVTSPALLDNGASRTVIDAALAERARLRKGDTRTMQGWSNTAEVRIAAPVAIEVGGFSATIAPLVMPFTVSGPPQPVLLGRDLFADQVVEIDFDHARLRISDRPHFLPSPGFQKVTRPTRVAGSTERAGDFQNLIDAEFEGRPIRASLDLGSDRPLHLSRALVDKWRLLEGRPVSSTMSGDIGGFRTTPVFTCAAFALGGAVLRGVPVEVFDSEDELAVVGLQLISRFNLALGVSGEALWLAPRPDELSRPFAKDRAGLAVLPQGSGLKVMFVAPGSPAARSGWQAGEVIAAVDGAPALAEGKAWRQGPAGTSHRLTRADGAERVLTLADYF